MVHLTSTATFEVGVETQEYGSTRRSSRCPSWGSPPQTVVVGCYVHTISDHGMTCHTMPCNTTLHHIIWYGMAWHGSAWCVFSWHGMTWHYITWGYNTVRDTALYDMAIHYIAMLYVALHYIVLHIITPHYAAILYIPRLYMSIRCYHVLYCDIQRYMRLSCMVHCVLCVEYCAPHFKWDRLTLQNNM